MRKQLRNTIIWLVILLIVGVGCFLIGYKISEKNKDKCETEPIPTKEEEPKKEDNKIDKRTAEELVSPFIGINNYCDSTTFIYKNTQKYEDLDPSVAIQIALDNYTYEEWQTSYEEAKKEHEVNLDEEDEFPDIKTSYINEKIAYTFGKDKTIKFPKHLDFWYESYELKGDKYVLEGQGGGCTGFTNYIRTKVIEGIETGNEYVVQVNFAYITYDVKENAEEIDARITVYNNLNKKRVIVKDAKYDDDEVEELDKLLDGDKTDYMLFTFKLEDDHYIFDKVEVVER